VSWASLDAAGLGNTLHVLEGIVAEGKGWIHHERRREEGRVGKRASACTRSWNERRLHPGVDPDTVRRRARQVVAGLFRFGGCGDGAEALAESVIGLPSTQVFMMVPKSPIKIGTFKYSGRKDAS
jgi:hypothetical protein